MKRTSFHAKYFDMYNLREEAKKYLQLDESQLNSLFKGRARYKIHMALSATQKYFGDQEGKLEKKRMYFKDKL